MTNKKTTSWLRQLAYLILVWAIMPIFAQSIIAIFMITEIRSLLSLSILDSLIILASILTPLLTGYFFRFNKKRLPIPHQTFFERYKIETLIILFTLVISFGSLFFDAESTLARNPHPIFLISLVPFTFPFLFISLGRSPFYLFFLIPIGCYTLYFFGVLLKTWRLGCFKVNTKGLLPFILATLLLAGGCAWQTLQQTQTFISAEEENLTSQVAENSDNVAVTYRPFSGNDDVLTPLRGERQLFIENDFPKLDGATALYPIYASAAQAIYKTPQTDQERALMRSLVENNKTPNAYQNLIDGKVDLIFAASPSTKQLEAARAQGLELQLTPIGKEAFVFLTHEQNPISSLTVEQIRDIYSGKINSWQEVGGPHTEIRAFQRPEGSGSQTALQKLVMQGTPLRQPLKEEFLRGMGGMIVGVANYRNAKNAIGYSFRFYATALNQVDGIKLLAINGIEPTRENIRNNSYPFTSELYMVTARPVSPNTQKLMNWFVSEQGQQLISDVGYVPLLETNN